MTREETVKIIRIMVDSYPNYKPNDISETADVWQMMLEEYSYQQVSVALKAYMLSDSSGFAPSIGQLVDKMQSIQQPQELNEMEAWALVSKAIRNSGYNSVEEFAKLPPLVQKAVGLPDQLRVCALDEHYNEGVVRGHFINCYKVVLERERELQKMPKSIQNMIESINVNSIYGEIDMMRQKAIDTVGISKNALEDKRECVPMPEEKVKELYRELGK